MKKNNFYIGFPFCGIVFFSLLDSFFTIHLMKNGFIEVNPLMRYFIELGDQIFLFVKYMFTVTGVLILFKYRDRFLFGSKFTAYHAAFILMFFYVALIAYEIFSLTGVINGVTI